MNTLKRSNTMQNLKRSNTMQTLKRAGTGAWRWINAEDVNINQNHPQGVSYFQRSNTLKRINASNSMRRRPTRNQSQYSQPQYNQQSYASSSNYPNSYGANNGYNYPNQSNSYNYPNQSNSYNYPNQQGNNYNNSYNNSYNYPNQNDDYNYQADNSFTNLIPSSNDNYQYPNQSNSYKYPSQSNSYKYPSRSNTQISVKRPEPAAEKYEKGNMDKRKKDSKIPSVLYDPEVRKQLEQLKEHKPYFMYIMTFLQVFFLLITFYKNYTVTNKVFESVSSNPMIGPSAGSLITMGARFLPCMKETEYVNYDIITCTPGIKGTVTLDPTQCSLADFCSFGMKKGDKPNQWYRFVIPILLHGGIAHIFFNLTFQIRTGIQMEKDFGTWRIIIIYMASGIFGFAFEATSMPTSPSVGCSGALYGLLPYIDNYAHFGGFLMGILTGFIFLPSIIFSKRDLRIKRILMLISIFLSIGLYIWVFRQFYVSGNQCSWCKYLNCLPIGDWCKTNDIQSNTSVGATNSTSTHSHHF
ncbi:hypothetical protein PIROE2DRAFT_69431 [Piromyces sp. E2]|nr:hypothetical protein PIROE2DRAFT_69431 [Piromyces sp. E2]|eukprot:OUM62982.1 hypothetical protein PIROE2DRAFT_69431 [Piromyces sp. E2]